MTPQLRERIGALQQTTKPLQRVSLTELARGKQWRQELAGCGMMEVIDRTETAAWLVSDQQMEELLYAVVSLEEELEQARVDALFDARSDYQNWLQGDSLAEAALQRLQHDGAQIKESIHEL